MSAQKHNLYALGNNGGQPPFYETPEQLEAKVIEYFDFCNESKEPVTISGLTQFLGFVHRQSLLDQMKRGQEFSDIIKRAKQAVEVSYEKDLRTMRFGGSIFALKNINSEHWRDKIEQEVKQVNDYNLDNLTPEELKSLLALQDKMKR